MELSFKTEGNMMTKPEKDEILIFAHNLTWLRKKHGLSKRDMARRLGIGMESLNKLEQGIIPPRQTANIFLKYEDILILPPHSSLHNG